MLTYVFGSFNSMSNQALNGTALGRVRLKFWVIFLLLLRRVDSGLRDQRF